RHELFEDRVCVFAMRALQVAEVHNGDRGVCRPFRRPESCTFKFFARGLEGMRAEREQVAGYGMLAILRHIKSHILRSPSSLHADLNFGESLGRRWFDVLNLPRQFRLLIAEHL